jgi:hypothetical protein
MHNTIALHLEFKEVPEFNSCHGKILNGYDEDCPETIPFCRIICATFGIAAL